MTYSDDLIAQANILATADQNKPKQASLRRAVSAAYYALFHEIVDRSVRFLLTEKFLQSKVGARLRRVPSHAAVARASKWFTVPNPPPSVQRMRMGGSTPLTDLVIVCQALVDLQEERHRADYDLFSPFTRADALRLVVKAEQAIRSLRGIKQTDDLAIFLLGCMFDEKLTKNP